MRANPAQSPLEFSWRGEVRQNGSPVSLGPYPRYNKPYAQVEFLPETINIRTWKMPPTPELALCGKVRNISFNDTKPGDIYMSPGFVPLVLK